jgi:dTDP-4-dehydrorhamnose reductase
MKVLILGYHGQLGRCLYDQLEKTDYDVVYTSRDQIDIADFNDTVDKIKKIQPNIIINATAYTSVDEAEQNKDTADLINHLAVANIAKTCNELDCWLVHISTDYVFDGTSMKSYREDDQTNPQSVYGNTKLKGEHAIKFSKCKHIIIRTAWVYSEYGNNFLKTMVRLSATKSQLHIVGDQIGCPTYAQDIAKAIVAILEKLKSKKFTSGLYHFGGNFSCSWAEFAQEIFDQAVQLKIIASKPNILTITSKEFPTLAKRPKRSELNSNKISSTLSIDPSDCILGIRSSLMSIKNPTY